MRNPVAWLAKSYQCGVESHYRGILKIAFEPMSSSSHAPRGRRSALPVAACALLLLLALYQVASRPSSAPLPDSESASAATRPVRSGSLPSVPDEKPTRRPLPVAQSSHTHEWTAGDASSPAVIEKIAHNPEEFIRMVEENDRIKRRQLVYRKHTAAAAVQAARASGEPLNRLLLPALDGREIEFEILRTDLDPSGQKGSFAGRISGIPNSMVILSFKNDREAFSLSSPDEGLHLQADPREPGEIIVKSIDPATYIQGKCGTLTGNP